LLALLDAPLPPKNAVAREASAAADAVMAALSELEDSWQFAPQ